MKLLALDTSAELCSTALLLEQEVIVREAEVPRRHANVILDMLDELLAAGGLTAADLDAIAFGRGPGSFTGVRIAAAVTQGIAYSLDIPVIPVSTLAAVAQTTVDTLHAERVLTALDARMEEVYWGGFTRGSDGFVEAVIDEIVMTPDAVVVPESVGWVGAGHGWNAYHSDLIAACESVVKAIYPDIGVHAASIASLGEYYFKQGHFLNADQAIPVYLRNKVAEKPRR